MDEKEAKELLNKYLNGTATPHERALFEQLSNRVTQQRLNNATPDNYDDIKARIYKKLPQPQQPSLIERYKLISIAASVIICIGIVVLFYQYISYNPNNNSSTLAKSTDVAPGSNQAILTLANGKKITLNNTVDGELAKQAGISITQLHSGQLVYNVAKQAVNTPAEYNTTETPRSGQYQIKLADGTRVWLNSLSSLKYPTHFEGNERNVELTGEAYFEVAHNANMPFKVKTAKQVITVLGTHFNVNAYADEPSVKTTLLQGKVKVDASKGTASEILKPGEQSSIATNKITVTTGDTEEAVAWKNGYFRFRGESIQSIMRKLSRWYNIDVKYESAIPNEGYYGTISRFKNISQVLAVLTETQSVHFKVEGRSVTVMQ